MESGKRNDHNERQNLGEHGNIFLWFQVRQIHWINLHNVKFFTSTKHETKTRNPSGDAKVLAPNYVNVSSLLD